ncbi:MULTISPECIES: MliC family protein [unclassified Thioalkalivibrio]|uniref:MliC family protein n=1 Tax=unclassified Thioalkalivibrio TaxID=2621013 RepID=UPI000368CDC9|nr:MULTISPECIES: MliC family protein [unclassified Thioalkalivibrio]
MRPLLVLAGIVLLAGCSALPRGDDAPREVSYICAYGPEFTATFEDDQALLAFNGARARLQATETAYGGRYANPTDEIVFWTRDDAAMLEMVGVFWSCRALPPRR